MYHAIVSLATCYATKVDAQKKETDTANFSTNVLAIWHRNNLHSLLIWLSSLLVNGTKPRIKQKSITISKNEYIAFLLQHTRATNATVTWPNSILG